MTFGKAVKSNVLKTSRIIHNISNDVFISNNIINSLFPVWDFYFYKVRFQHLGLSENIENSDPYLGVPLSIVFVCYCLEKAPKLSVNFLILLPKFSKGCSEVFGKLLTFSMQCGFICPVQSPWGSLLLIPGCCIPTAGMAVFWWAPACPLVPCDCRGSKVLGPE